MISRFHISTTRPSQSLERLERSVRRTSSVTMPTASSSGAAGSTKAAQLRLARGRPESLSRPCVLLRPPVWHRLTKRRLLAARSNGRTNKAEPCPKRLCLSEIKSGHIRDAIRRGQGGKQCALPSLRCAIGAHPYPRPSACASHYSSERKISESGADVLRPGQ